ncbi:MAG: hypothetical protein WD225_09695 [Ilumatobacteraceae bacterium]
MQADQNDRGRTTPAADEPSADEPSAPAPVPPISDDDPLFEPLPALQPDPDNDLPDDEELAILELVATALHSEALLFASGRVDPDLLARTHGATAYDKVAERAGALAEQGVIERLPDLRHTSIEVRNAIGEFMVVVRTCFEPGPRSGLYDAASREMVAPMGEALSGTERLVRRAFQPAPDEPDLLVIDVQDALLDRCV